MGIFDSITSIFKKGYEYEKKSPILKTIDKAMSYTTMGAPNLIRNIVVGKTKGTEIKQEINTLYKNQAIAGAVGLSVLGVGTLASKASRVPKALTDNINTSVKSSAPSTPNYKPSTVLGKSATPKNESGGIVTKVKSGLEQVKKVQGALGSGSIATIKETVTQASTSGAINSTTSAVSTPTRRTSTTRRKKRRTSKKSKRRKHYKRSRKKRYGTAKQYARKGGKSVKYTKNGQPYIILSNGRARFVKGRRRK